MKFFDKINNAARRFMYGRYGIDALSKAIFVLSLFLLLLSSVTRIAFFYACALSLLLWSYFRIFSKNRAKRYRELSVYTGKVNLIKNRWHDRKTHRYFRCRACKQWLRVPKKKGKIKITCRACGKQMIKKT